MSNPSTPPPAPNQANAHPNTQTRTQTPKHAPKAQESTHQSPRANKAKPKTPAAKAHATPNPTAQNAQKNSTRESNPHSARATIPQPTAPQSHAPKPSPKPTLKPTLTKMPQKTPQENLLPTARAPQSRSPQPHNLTRAHHNPKKPDSTPLTPSKSTPPHEPHELIEVAKLGKSIGVHGALKCHLLTDFPEIFQKGAKFFAIFSSPYEQITHPLTLQAFDPQRHLIAFEEITSMEAAKSLTNFILHSTLEDTRKHCALGKEEFFWFDIIGCRVCEAGILLGEVREIQRIGATDYLLVRTDSTLQKSAPTPLAKEFLIPYIAPFIKDTDLEAKTIYTQNAKALLEAS